MNYNNKSILVIKYILKFKFLNIILLNSNSIIFYILNKYYLIALIIYTSGVAKTRNPI